MAFKQYLKAELTALDEVYHDEEWRKDFPGRGYYDVQLSTIAKHETAEPMLREFLGKGGLRILESGCGTGRWIAFFESLGNWCVGIDDSWGPLRVAHGHDPAMPLVQANVVRKPFRDGAFDVVLSAYVAEHFQDGPEQLFREIHRVLKANGLFLVVVPFNNTFRRLVVNPALRFFYLVWRLRRRPLGFTEFRYLRAEMDGFLARTNFEVLHVQPDDYRLPWTKGLFCDACDVGSFVHYAPKPPYEFGRFGVTVARIIQSFGLWHSCEGIFYVARARK